MGLGHGKAETLTAITPKFRAELEATQNMVQIKAVPVVLQRQWGTRVFTVELLA